MARKTDQELRIDEQEAIQRELRPGETPLDRLRLLRCIQRSPWHHSGFTRDAGDEIAFGAVLPSSCKSESEWEAKCQTMHDSQISIALPSKPVERARLRGSSATAELHVSVIDEAFQKFHESPASTETQKRTKRAD